MSESASVRQAPSGIRRPDVRAVIRAVTPSGTSAVVPVAELYRVYCEQMAAQDREPVSAHAFGLAMSRCGQRQVHRGIDGRNVRCRVIHERFMAAEEFDYEPAPA